jgi:tripartite-type tricarboxylate transporter receptor subunit TctC
MKKVGFSRNVFFRTFKPKTFQQAAAHHRAVPGGIVDLMARCLEKLAAGLGQPVLVEARPGASAGLGLEAVLKSDPDGYPLAGNAVHVTSRRSEASGHRDFAGVALITTSP